jgi:hypothetical protein
MAVWGWCAIGIDISVAALMQHNYSPEAWFKRAKISPNNQTAFI